MRYWHILAAMLLLLPFVYATTNGVCIVASAETCYNATDNSYGPNAPGVYDGTAAECTSAPTAGLGGTYNGTASALTQIQACTTGCCCDGITNRTTINASCSATNFITPVAGDDASCRLTCNTPPNQQACGQGPITDNTCYCGSQNGLSGAYCCWNGKPANNQTACDPLPTTQQCLVTDATHNYQITQSCWCGGTVLTSGVCCYGQTRQDNQQACIAVGPPGQNCGDGQVQTGEQCDATGADAINNAQCAAKFGSDTSWLCTASCTCLASPTANTCGNGICEPSDGETCSDCPQQNRCTLAAGSSLPSPTITNASYDINTNSVTIQWLNPTECQANRLIYLIQRSSISAQAARYNPDTTPVNLTASATTYTDTSMPTDTTVLYYQIVSSYQMSDGSVQTAYVSTTVNKRSPDCPSANVQYCKNPYTAVSCTGYVASETPCGTALCTMVGNTAACQPASPECDKCNGLFASFVDDNLLICKYSPPPGTSCASASQDRCSLVPSCYKDLGSTSVPYYQGCSNVNSCTSYLSEGACKSNTCQKPGPCVWQNLSSGTGGICVPQNSAYSVCSDCDKLGASCTQEACHDINSACIYKGPTDGVITDGTRCVDPKDMVCEYYATQPACDGGKPYQLDVKYDANGVRYNTTNNVTQKSADLAGVGKCVWFADRNECLTDADLDHLADRDQVQTATTTPAQVMSLLRDRTPPVTSILAIPRITYPATVSFATSEEPGSTSYACLAPQGVGCYPNMNLPPTWTHTFTSDQSGTYELRFYSQDAARNLEGVESFMFNVDASPPNITIINTTTTLIRQPNNQPPRILWTMYFNSSEQSQCTTQLLNNNSKPFGQDVDNNGVLYPELNAFGQEFGITYNLAKGTYFTNSTCTDSNGNANSQLEPIIADTDLRINSLAPHMTVDNPTTNATIDISAHTEQPASCKYGPPGQQYSAMTAFTTTGGTVHSASVSTVNGLTNYTVACNISGNVLFEDTDYISIVVDRLPPKTTACDDSGNCSSGTGTLFNATAGDDTFHISLSCQDSPAQGAFGVRNILWCIQNPSGNCALGEYQNFPIPVPLSTDNDTKITVRCQDNGFNQETPWTLTVSTRDRTPPAAPTFSVEPVLS